MTMMPPVGALRPRHPQTLAPEFLAYDFNEACTVLIGWQRREAVLRMISATHAVIGGVTGLRQGDCLRLVLHRGQTVMRECRVVGMSLQGVELEHNGTGMLAFATM
jgi:hypothetical protein